MQMTILLPKKKKSKSKKQCSSLRLRELRSFINVHRLIFFVSCYFFLSQRISFIHFCFLALMTMIRDQKIPQKNQKYKEKD